MKMGETLEASFAQNMNKLTASMSNASDRIGIAVSGGGDSLALMHLAWHWARGVSSDICLEIATIDHGLRPEAAAEARYVRELAQKLDLSCHILKITPEKSGNMQANARKARYEALEGWRKKRGLAAILLGHTADDQAETFLQRLCRGSGVDGLAGMPAISRDRRFWRPLLNIRRESLRAWLLAKGIQWVEDPSNEDPKYSRVRIRKMLAELEQEGLSLERLLQTTKWMGSAKEALDHIAFEFVQNHVRNEAGLLFVSRAAFLKLSEETQLRVLSGALKHIGGASYRPRLAALKAFREKLVAGGNAELSGVRSGLQGNHLCLFRDYAAVRNTNVPLGDIWDERLKVLPARHISELDKFRIAALGEAGASSFELWRGQMPRAAAVSQPALFQNGIPVFLPWLQSSKDWTIIPAGRAVEPFAEQFLHQNSFL